METNEIGNKNYAIVDEKGGLMENKMAWQEGGDQFGGLFVNLEIDCRCDIVGRLCQSIFYTSASWGLFVNLEIDCRCDVVWRLRQSTFFILRLAGVNVPYYAA